MTIAIAISDHILASKLLILILYNTFKDGESGSPFVQYIHVLTSQSKPDQSVLQCVPNLYLFAKPRQKGKTRDGRGSFPKWGESPDETSQDQDDDKSFRNFGLSGWLLISSI